MKKHIQHLLYAPQCLIALMWLASCSETYSPGILYQAQTPGCINWADGSRFELPKQISVFAGVPDAVGRLSIELNLAYFVPATAATTFEHQIFSITVPHGREILRGVVTSIERSPSPVRHATTVNLSALPQTLIGETSSEETMYKIYIRFSGEIPDRFDFTPPPMAVDQRAYPVRTYTYRFFKERDAYGLCT